MAADEMERLTYRVSAAAKQDIELAADYYEQRRPGLGREFTNAVVDTIQRICQHPTSGSFISRRARVCKTSRFPYGVVYQHRADHIFVAVVYHLHRDPDFWKDRLSES
jgi:plasmid stabilization system protein ParE